MFWSSHERMRYRARLADEGRIVVLLALTVNIASGLL